MTKYQYGAKLPDAKPSEPPAPKQCEYLGCGRGDSVCELFHEVCSGYDTDCPDYGVSEPDGDERHDRKAEEGRK